MRVRIVGSDEQRQRDDFLIDTGADRTVLGAGVLAELRLPVDAPPHGVALTSIGGEAGMVLVTTTLEFTRDDGGAVRVRGRLAGFTDPRATDVCILGRGVLDNFGVIINRRRDEVLLLTPPHEYQLSPP